MIFWEGTGEVHVTFQGRKPTQYGIEFKDMACGIAHIMLMIELAEGKDKDALKEYRDAVGATTACTLRLTAPYSGTGRCGVWDAWFQNCNTAEWVKDVHGLDSIGAIKTGHKGYPKALILEKLGEERGCHVCYKLTVELDTGATTFYASGFRDK
jgi:hypothetical protein